MATAAAARASREARAHALHSTCMQPRKPRRTDTLSSDTPPTTRLLIFNPGSWFPICTVSCEEGSDIHHSGNIFPSTFGPLTRGQAWLSLGGEHRGLRVTGRVREPRQGAQVCVPASEEGRGLRGQHSHLRSGLHQRAAVRESHVNQEDGGEQEATAPCWGSLRKSGLDLQAQEGAPMGTTAVHSEAGVG